MLALILGLVACSGQKDSGFANGPEPEVETNSPTLRRLTTTQYHNVISDVLGEGIVIPSLEPDDDSGGLLSLGAAVTTISPVGVERYENAAQRIAAQVLGDSERVDKVSLKLIAFCGLNNGLADR